MNVEIVFTGLCSILNPDGTNEKMGEPGVILVQTPEDPNASPEVKAHDHGHVAFLAFDTAKVDVTGASNIQNVKGNQTWRYIPLDAVEITVENNAPAVPQVLDSYWESIAHRDDYWPEKAGEFDRDFVPLAGHRPKSHAVKAWMRFGKGKIEASRISEAPWRFETSNGPVEKCFAEEVVYSGFLHSGDAVVLQLKDLEEGKKDVERLAFSLKPGVSADSMLTLIIGNLEEEDMLGATNRDPTVSARFPEADHFKYLNRIAGHGDGPTPVVVNPKVDLRRQDGGGGSSGGACGPGSGNGGKGG